MTGTAAALLRGINVGGKNPLPMKAPAEIFTHAGCVDVKTYIQSGNVVFGAPIAEGLKDVASCVRGEIETRFGIKVPVVIRTVAELRRVLRSNPFFTSSCELAQLHVMFLEDEPAAGLVAALDTDRSPPDEFVVVGGEIYLRLPHGAAKTRLTNAYFDTKLKTVSTQRNWRTVQTMADMAGVGLNESGPKHESGTAHVGGRWPMESTWGPDLEELVAESGADGDLMAALGAATTEDSSACLRLHAGKEAVGLGAMATVGLEGTLWHGTLYSCAGSS